MVFTARLALLAAVGMVPLLLLKGTASMWIWLLYNLLIAGLALVDFSLSPRPSRFSVVRRAETVFSLGAENRVLLEVRNPAGWTVPVEIKDDVPPSFGGSRDPLRLSVPPGQREQADYRVTPTRRGDYQLGPIHLRYAGPLGLIKRRAVLKDTFRVKVYPNLADIRKYEILARQGRTLEEGLKRARAFGLGTEFESVRDYVPDDESRVINWSATARRGKLASNQYQTDRSQSILLVIDAGRLMMPQVKGLSKLDYTINASLMLAYVGLSKDDRVGLLVFSGETKAFLPPKKGRGQLLSLLDTLYSIEPEMVESDYAAAVSFLKNRNKKRSLVCFFTDLIDPDASKEVVTYLSSLGSGHLGLCITLSDPEILRLAGQDPTDSPAVYQKSVAEDVLARREEAKSILRRRGILVLDVPPGQLSAAVVNQYLEIKRRGRL